MIIGKNLDTKETTITLSAEESEQFNKNQRIRKVSGDSKGAFYVDVKFTRPKKTNGWLKEAKKKYSDKGLHTGHY